jgi:hypothetical protein
MSDLYDADRCAWLEQQLVLARSGRAGDLDLPHLAEQMEDALADREGEVARLARRVMQHLLYLDHSPAKDPRPHWEAEVLESQAQLRDALSRRLRQRLQDRLDREYAAARRVAAKKLEAFGEAEAAAKLPAARPYTLQQIEGEEP